MTLRSGVSPIWLPCNARECSVSMTMRPCGASAAEGAALLAALSDDLVAAVAAWRGPGPG